MVLFRITENETSKMHNVRPYVYSRPWVKLLFYTKDIRIHQLGRKYLFTINVMLSIVLLFHPAVSLRERDMCFLVYYVKNQCTRDILLTCLHETVGLHETECTGGSFYLHLRKLDFY